MAETRVRCPMLNDAQMCEIYEFRPLTCKLYGIPTAIGGKGYTCGLSGFEKGEKYPTASLDKIQNRLLAAFRGAGRGHPLEVPADGRNAGAAVHGAGHGLR